MTIPRALLFCILIFSTCPFHAQSTSAQKNSKFSGTWFGDFIVTRPDGKVSHDTAVLMLEQSGSLLKGSMGRTVDQQSPLADGSFHGSHARFHLEAAGGLEIELDLHEGRLTGTATGKQFGAKFDLRSAPGLLPHPQLLQEIALADQQLYEAFGNCDVAGYASFLSRKLEFYQDHTGKTDYEQNLRALESRCAEGIGLRRELEKDTLIVNAAPGFGAIEAGTHRFYSRGQDGKEQLDATARFTNIWSKETGSWKLVRIISYDHQ